MSAAEALAGIGLMSFRAYEALRDGKSPRTAVKRMMDLPPAYGHALDCFGFDRRMAAENVMYRITRRLVVCEAENGGLA